MSSRGQAISLSLSLSLWQAGRSFSRAYKALWILVIRLYIFPSSEVLFPKPWEWLCWENQLARMIGGKDTSNFKTFLGYNYFFPKQWKELMWGGAGERERGRQPRHVCVCPRFWRSILEALFFKSTKWGSSSSSRESGRGCWEDGWRLDIGQLCHAYTYTFMPSPSHPVDFGYKSWQGCFWLVPTRRPFSFPLLFPPLSAEALFSRCVS